MVTERLIDERNLDTVKEALKNTAGITFQAAEGGEEDIRLRGFPLAQSGDIFVDGIRDPLSTIATPSISTASRCSVARPRCCSDAARPAAR